MNSKAKPISLVRADFINSLAGLINNCTLPPFIIEDILKNMYNEVHAISQRQFENDLKNYNDEADKSEE